MKSFRKPWKIVGGLLGPLVLLALLPAPANAYPRPGITERISVASDGAEASGQSYDSAISTDGRLVAFRGGASDLVPGDTNGTWDVFVHDRAMGTTERISVSSDGAEANSSSGTPAITPDGRHVAFYSAASNLVPGDTNGTWDVFVHDRATGTTERVSLASGGAEANSHSYDPAISANGRHVAFHSVASDLVPGDTNGTWDVFVHDRATGTTERVSVASDGAEADAQSTNPAISADGRHIAFLGFASNLVSGDTNGVFDAFVHDRATGTTERVSVASDGAEGSSHSKVPVISADGRHVAFHSSASNLVPGDTNRASDVFVHDRATGTTERVSVASDGAEANSFSLYVAISAAGRHVAFYSNASNLVPADTNATWDVFVYDRATGTTERVSVASDGAEAYATSDDLAISPAISAGGGHVAFHSNAFSLVPADTNATWDVFVHNRGGSLGVVGTLSVLKASGGVGVSGRATFSGMTVAGATDPDDDGTGMGLGAAAVGAELTGAALIYRPEQEDLLLRLDLASLPGNVGRCLQEACIAPNPGAGLPGAGLPGILYGADLRVGETRYEVRALRAAATADPPRAPYMALYRCAPDCSEHAPLSGGIGTTGTEVLLSLPLGALEAPEGTELSDLRAFTATGEARPGALVPLDEVPLSSAVIPASRVELGIADATTPEDEVAFTVAADLLAGDFSGTIPTTGLSLGSYRVWARACLGDACGPAAPDPVTLGDGTSPTPSPTPTPSEPPPPGVSDVSFTEDSATAGQYSDETLFKARLDDSNGDPIEGAELTFELTGAGSSRSFTQVTGEDGVAAVTPTLGEKPGPYQLTVRYEGDPDHQGSVASADSRRTRAPIDRQVRNAIGVTSAIVHVRPEETLSEGLRLARAAGADTGTTYGAIKLFVAYGTPGTFKRLAKSPAIEYIEANRRLRYFTDTSHRATRGQDVLDGEVTLPDGTTIDGAGIGVAVVDSGIDGTHPDLVGRMGGNVKIICTTPQPVVTSATGGFTECLGPKQAVSLQDTDTPSAGGHGTHVAGIVAGTGAASSGTNHGAAPGATLYGVSVGTAILVENALDGLAWVLENHDQVTPEIRVVNNSWGSGYRKYDPQNGPFHKATWKLQEALVEAGVSVVFAAGNSSGNGSASTTSAECINPTPGIVCVANYNGGGTGTRSGSISASSSRGKSDEPLEWPDISAPGTRITSTCRVTLPVCTSGSGQITNENTYRSLSGTSMAAPHVAGIIAQIYQADPTLTLAEVENHLEDTAHKFSFGSTYGLRADPTNPDSGSSFEKGHGLVDVVAVLNAILNEPEASPTPSSSPSATATPSPTPTGTPPGNQGSTDTTSFVVEKEDSALELTETKGKDKALVAHLYDGDTPADGVAGRTIDFYAGAELIGSGTTNDDGVATFEAPSQKGKKKTYEARFVGDDFYLESSDSQGKGGNGGGGNGGGGNGGRDASTTSGGKVLLM